MKKKIMKKKILCLLCAVSMVLLSACGNSASPAESKAETKDNVQTESQTALPAETAAQTKQSQTESEEAAQSEETSQSEPMVISEGSAVRVGSLKGPTSMGLVSLMDKNGKGESAQSYEFNMVSAADELVAAISSKEVDIALVPANVASVLYNKTQGGVSVLNINTLGVVYIVESGDSITSVADLKGKTLCMSGKGTTPDYVLQYLLSQNGLTADDLTIEYKSEASEVAAVLANDENAVGLLPQPFVTVACSKNEKLHVALDLTKEWDACQGDEGSRLVTAVTIVRNEFLEENEELVKTFMEEAAASADFTNTNVDEAAEMVASLGIVEKAGVAKQAIPFCNITYIDGDEMKQALSGYLSVLFEQNPQSVGGSLPADDFYYSQKF